MVAVCVKKSVANVTVAKECDPDTNAVVAGNIQNEFERNSAEEELENPASSSQKNKFEVEMNSTAGKADTRQQGWPLSSHYYCRGQACV